MARYVLIHAVAGAPLNGGYTKYPRGSTVADSAENALAGDLIWPALCQAPSPTSMRPLDAAAAALMRMPITTLAAVASSSEGGAAGENVGS